MNYLQSGLFQAQQGNNIALNHLAYCVQNEQVKIIDAINKHKVWYVDIPRTSSTSIKIMLGNKFGYPLGKDFVPGEGYIFGTSSQLLASHTLASLAKEIISPKLWDSINTFAVVRNPYTWCLSLWGYAKKYYHMDLNTESFEHFLISLESRLSTPKNNRIFYPSNYMQSDYVTDRGGEVIVKHLLRYEDRESINEYLIGIGVTSILQDKLVSSNGLEYTMSSKEKNLVHRIFQKDFDILGY